MSKTINKSMDILDIIAPELIEALQVSDPILESLDRHYNDTPIFREAGLDDIITTAVLNTEETAFKAGFSAAMQLVSGRYSAIPKKNYKNHEATKEHDE